jgi:hypothetical protein
MVMKLGWGMRGGFGGCGGMDGWRKLEVVVWGRANWRCGGLWELKINDRGSVGVGELRGRAVMFVTDGGGIEYTKLFGLA